MELLADKERLEKLVDGNSSRLTTLEMLYDKQVISIQKMEEDQQLLRTEIEEKDQQLREMVRFLFVMVITNL